MSKRCDISDEIGPQLCGSDRGIQAEHIVDGDFDIEMVGLIGFPRANRHTFLVVPGSISRQNKSPRR